MDLIFSPQAWEDYTYWQETDKRQVKRINALIRDCIRSPFAGLGKPEALRANLQGWWSRRIDEEHRLVYRVSGSAEVQRLEIIQCRLHY